MPTWLSLTCENDRLMLLAAKVHGGTAVFERSFSYSLKPDDSGSQGQVAEDSGTPKALKKGELAELIQKHRLAKSETVVVLGRGDVEVRPMVFPPVPVEELPDLVRFQASKEFNGYDPSSPLDFVMTDKLENVSRSTLFPAVRAKGKADVKETPASIGGPKHLLASTIRNETLRKIQLLCEELNLNLRRVVLRPCEVAFLWRRSPEFDPGRTYLFVELDATEAPQSVLHHGLAVFMRSPKIGGSDDPASPEFATKLLAELKRTRIAVRNEIQGVTIDEVVLCGTGNRFDKLAKQLTEGLGVPVVTFDPWKDIQRTDELTQSLPESPERFAALIGATIQAAKGEASDIDFCNPKKRPEPVGQRQMLTGIVAAVLFLLIVFIGYGVYSRSVLLADIKALSNKVNRLKSTAAGVTEQRNQLAAIDAWLLDNVNWFEQLDWLSRKLPGSREMILNDLTISANSGGSMTLKTLVQDSSVLAPMEGRLRDEKHLVKPGEMGEQKGSHLYGIRYNLSIFLSKAAAAAATEEPPPTDAEASNPAEPSANGQSAAPPTEKEPPPKPLKSEASSESPKEVEPKPSTDKEVKQ